MAIFAESEKNNMDLKIEVYYTEDGSSSWKLLPETSEYLTEKQLIPNVRDGFTLSGNDGTNILELEQGDIKHIMTVKRRWYNYASSDVAILLHYSAW